MLPKLDVAGSNPVARSKEPLSSLSGVDSSVRDWSGLFVEPCKEQRSKKHPSSLFALAFWMEEQLASLVLFFAAHLSG